MRLYRSHRNARRWLLRGAGEDEHSARKESLVKLLSAGAGLSRAEAKRRIGD
jgi:hypothetical protein